MFGILDENNGCQQLWEETFGTKEAAIKRVNECFFPFDEELKGISIIEFKPILKPTEPSEIQWTSALEDA